MLLCFVPLRFTLEHEWGRGIKYFLNLALRDSNIFFMGVPSFAFVKALLIVATVLVKGFYSNLYQNSIR